jgi:chloride channel 3/4/5
LIGILTACVAFLVDIAEATVSDYKQGYCSTNLRLNREACCTPKSPFVGVIGGVGEDCKAWKAWSHGYWSSFAIYVGFAVLFGIVAGSVTLTTKATLPVADGDDDNEHVGGGQGRVTGKSMYSTLKRALILSILWAPSFFSGDQFSKSRRIGFETFAKTHTDCL